MLYGNEVSGILISLFHSLVPPSSLVFRPYREVEKGSGVLSDISCYMGRGLCTKSSILAFFF